MILRLTRPSKRFGAITPLAAIMSVVILGIVAFSVDTAWIVLARSELQNAADAAALAGANELMSGYVQYNLPGQTAETKTSIINSTMANARTRARQFAGYNSAGGVSSLVLNDSDITFGFIDQAGAYTASTSSGPFPNTVKVLMRRDSQANQSLKLFFAPVLGVNAIDVTASAGATPYTAQYDSFAPVAGQRVGMLPVAYDVNDWNKFMATGQDPGGNIRRDSSGNPVLKIYPSIQDHGNFGLISLDDSHVGASTMASWIHNGATDGDIQALKDHGLIPLSSHLPNTWDWNAENGFKASNVMDINSHIGQTYVIPLFQPKNNGVANPSDYRAGVGEGSNYDFNIVAFVGIKIMPVSENNGEVVVQPAAILIPSAIIGSNSAVKMGTSGAAAPLTTFTAPKLTN